MRTTLLVFTLTGLTVLAYAGDAQAQRRGYGGGGNSPYYSMGAGPGGYYSHSGYYNSYYGGRAYSPYYAGYGYGSGYYPGYYQPYGGAVVTLNRDYYATPNYAANPAVTQSFYSGPAMVQQPVTMTVIVPTANAQVWFGDTATTLQGTERVFHSPPLVPGNNYTYTIKAQWMENGQPVGQERQVNVQAGQRITINFRDNSSENAPAPTAIPPR